jgi:hypothetical protein
VLALVAAITPLVEQIKRLTQPIATALREHPDVEIFPSLFRDPRSVVTAAGLLAEIGDCRVRYPTRDTLAADAGQAAVAVESGERLTASRQPLSRRGWPQDVCIALVAVISLEWRRFPVRSKAGVSRGSGRAAPALVCTEAGGLTRAVAQASESIQRSRRRASRTTSSGSWNVFVSSMIP